MKRRKRRTPENGYSIFETALTLSPPTACKKAACVSEGRLAFLDLIVTD
jgi:hypothetical protein